MDGSGRGFNYVSHSYQNYAPYYGNQFYHINPPFDQLNNLAVNESNSQQTSSQQPHFSVVDTRSRASSPSTASNSNSPSPPSAETKTKKTYDKWSEDEQKELLRL